MYENVLIPTDGSDTISETLDHGLPIAESNQATVHALYVVDTRIVHAADADRRGELTDKLETEGERAVSDVVERAEEAGLEAVSTVRRGSPAKAILAYADEADADLIVIGTHGKSPREKHFTMGSVSEHVVDNASIPVFVVRNAGSQDGSGKAFDGER